MNTKFLINRVLIFNLSIYFEPDLSVCDSLKQAEMSKNAEKPVFQMEQVTKSSGE